MKHRPEYDMKIIGQNLKRLRKMKNLTVEEVREYLRLSSVQAVYKYEKGTSYPQVDTMFALMELYDADLYDIMCNSYEPNTIHNYREEDLADDNDLGGKFIPDCNVNQNDLHFSAMIYWDKCSNLYYEIVPMEENKNERKQRLMKYISLYTNLST